MLDLEHLEAIGNEFFMKNYKKALLSNGVPLISIPVKGARTTTVLVIFKTGSRNETQTTSGLSHFLEHMFFKGTDKRPDVLHLSSAMDALGGEYNAFTAKEFTGYWFKVARGKTAAALEILGDILFNSRFEDGEIEKEKGVIIEELNMYQDNPRIHIEDVFERCLYGDNSAGWNVLGNEENIRRFCRQNLVRYFRRQYGANSAQVVLAGAVSATDEKAAAQIFSVLKKNEFHRAPSLVKRQRKPQILLSPKKTGQTVISLGIRGLPIGHSDEFEARLLALILGGSMSSRLFISLRERSGLAYHVHTSAEFYSDSGYLTTETGVPRKKAEMAASIILEEYRRLKAELVPAEELRLAKEIFKGRLFLQLEASDNLAVWYARQAVYRKQILSPEEVTRKIEAISAESLRNLARRLFRDEHLNLALIGYGEKERLDKILKF